MKTQSNRDHEQFEYALLHMRSDDFKIWADVNNRFMSATMLARLEFIGDPADRPDLKPFERTRFMESTTRYIPSRLLTYHINPGCSSFDDMLLPKNELEAYPELERSCMAKAFIKVFKPSFDKYYNGNDFSTKKKMQLTLELIHQVCIGGTYNGGEITLTYEQSERFARKFGINLVVYTPSGKVLKRYDSPKQNSKLRPRTMHVVYHNEHVEPIDDMKSFQASRAYKNADDLNELSPSTLYPISSYAVNDDVRLAETPSDCFDAIRQSITSIKQPKKNNKTKENQHDQEDHHIEIIYNGDLHALLQTFLSKGYVPNGQFKSYASVRQISFDNLKIGKVSVKISISTPCDVHGFLKVKVRNVAEYLTFKEADARLKSHLLNKRHLSTFGSDTMETVFSDFGVQIQNCKLIDCETKGMHDVVMFDFIKAYASCLMTRPYLASMSYFEEPKPYTGGAIDDKNLYVVRFMKPYYVFREPVTMIFGYDLQCLVETCTEPGVFQVVAWMRLITHSSTLVSEDVNQLWNDPRMEDIDQTLRKGITNQAIGMAGKKYKQYTNSYIFNNEDDANRYMYYHCRAGYARSMKLDDHWVVHKNSEKVALSNGFVPIYEQVLSSARMQMLMLSKDLERDGYELVAYKTDAIYARKRPDAGDCCDPPHHHKWLTGGLGGVKAPVAVESAIPSILKPFALISDMPVGHHGCEASDTDDEYHNGTDAAYHRFMASIVDVHKPHEIVIDDERDIDEIAGKMRNMTVALGQGGCGKSHVVIMCSIKRFGPESILVITPYNRQASAIMHRYKDFGIKAITYHRWIGEGINGEQKNKAYDISGKTCLIFDEIMLYTHDKLIKISKYKEAHPELEFHGTGDPMQLEAINDTIGNQQKLDYVTGPKLFPNIINLKINKRLKTEEDRQKMNEIIHDMKHAVTNGDLHKVVRKHFGDKIVSSLHDLRAKGIMRAVSLFNASNRTLNGVIHQYFPHDMAQERRKLQNDVSYYQGSMLICKESLPLPEGKMHPNYVYTIKAFVTDADGMTENIILQDMLNDNLVYNVSPTRICSSFSLPYCNTVHSAQGDAINEPFVIADWACDHSILTVNWLYTAISRCERIEDVWFLDYNMLHINKAKAAADMVCGYRWQDKKAQRPYQTALYIDADWILTEYEKRRHCPMCNMRMTFEPKYAHKVTVDRGDNRLAHIKSNCRLMCKKCNIGKRNT